MWAAALALVWRRHGAVERATTAGAQPLRRPASPDVDVPQAGTASAVTTSARRLAGLALDTLDLSKVGAGRRDVGEGRQEDPHRHDAAERRAQPERTALDGFAANARAAPRQSRRPQRRPRHAGAASPEPHGIRQRDPRSARARCRRERRCCRPTARVEGFDNIAEALAVSPSLIQGYVSAAMKISRLAVGDRDDGAVADRRISPPPGLAQDRHIEGLPLGTRGGMLIQHTFPLDAEYEFALGGRGPAVRAPASTSRSTASRSRSRTRAASA